MIVGHQDVALHVFGGRAGIVLQPRQREVGAQPVEQGQRVMALRVLDVEAVGDLIADQRQFGGRKVPRQIERRHAVEVQSRAVQHVGVGDFLIRHADRHLGAVVADHQFELLLDMGAENVRAGDRGRIGAGPRETREGAVDLRMAVVLDQRLVFGVVLAAPDHGELRIAIAARGARRLRRQGAVVEIGVQVGLQMGDGLPVEVAQTADGLRCGQRRRVLGFNGLVHAPLVSCARAARQSAACEFFAYRAVEARARARLRLGATGA